MAVLKTGLRSDHPGLTLPRVPCSVVTPRFPKQASRTRHSCVPDVVSSTEVTKKLSELGPPGFVTDRL